jgi:flagellar motor switch protein FliM
MSEILSQSEIDALLTAINAGDCTPEDFRPKDDIKRIKIYDFARPDRFSKEHIRTISILHESFTRTISSQFSTLLQTPVHIHVASVDQLNYEEFIRSVPCPTTIGIIRYPKVADEYKQETPTFNDFGTAFEIDPCITFSIIDLLMGGTGENYEIQHELTNLEKVIIDTPLTYIINELRTTWTKVCDIRPYLGDIHTSPQFMQLTAPTEMGVLVTLEVKINDVEGLMNVYYPELTLKPILNKLNSNIFFDKPGASFGHIVQQQMITAALASVNVELKVELFRKTITLGELKSFKNNDIVYSDIIHSEKGVLISPTVAVFNQNKHLCDGIWSNFKDAEKEEKKAILIMSKDKNNIEDYMTTKNNTTIEKVQKTSLDDIKVQLIVELGRTTLPIKDITRFGEGTILELDTLAGEPSTIFANNVPIGKGEVCVMDEKFAIRIVELTSEGFKEE